MLVPDTFPLPVSVKAFIRIVKHLDFYYWQSASKRSVLLSLSVVTFKPFTRHRVPVSLNKLV